MVASTWAGRLPHLRLKYSHVVQGRVEPGELNLLFVFQVNCPGCFVHGFPLARRLHRRFGDSLNVLGLATAFEDHEFNNLANLELLAGRGIFVGETAKAMSQYGQESIELPIEFPLAFDLVGPAREIFTEEDIEFALDRAAPQSMYWKAGARERSLAAIGQQFQSQELVAATFHLNMMRGTPSWVLFNREHVVLESWFGHLSEPEVISVIKKYRDLPPPPHES